MKRFLLLPLFASLALAQSAVLRQSFVPLFTTQAATGTATSAAVRLPNYSGYGTLTITGAGITGSPSGCQITLAMQQMTILGVGVGPISTIITSQSFTPANTYQTVTITPAINTGSAMVAVFSCGVYPSAGTITVSFEGTSPVNVIGTVGISAASLPLPAGAATAAKQPALGTAGSASADVITVQGIASMIALKVDGSATTQPVSVVSLPLPSGASTSAKQPALGTAGSASSDVLSVQGIASMTPLKIDLSQVAGTTTSTGNGVAGAGVQRVTVASDNTAFPVNATLGAETTKIIGEVIPVATATTTDTTATCYLTSAATANSTNCKASAGNVYGIYIINTTSTNYFLRMYNSASAPTCSSATGFVEAIPALGAAANGGGISRMQVAQAFATGVGFCLTGGGSSTDNTSAATGVYVTILYK